MIQLPTCPPVRSASPRLVSFAVDQNPTLGGSQSRISRLGDRWAMDVETYPVRYANQGMAYLSRLVRGLVDTVLIAFPEPGVVKRSYGTPIVGGVGASGLTLPVSGLTPGVVIPEGKFLSLVISGQRYLYQVTANVTVVSGTNVLPIYPMLRRQPQPGAVVELESPKIEGFIKGNEQGWDVSRSKFLPFSFSIQEVA